MHPERYHLNTNIIHAGEPEVSTSQSHTNPIYQTSTFYFKNVAQGDSIFHEREKGYVYSRWGNPTVEVMEQKIAALEGHDLIEKDPAIKLAGLAFSSGMAALSTWILSLLKPGDGIIMQCPLYGGTMVLANTLLKDQGIQVYWVRGPETEAFERTLAAHPNIKLILLETPANPTLDLSDIQQVSRFAREHGVLVAVDNTFATPYLQRPLSLGADFAIHSTTKYICGHGTVVGGVIVSHHVDMIHDILYPNIKVLGGVPGPFEAWLVNQGLKTLHIRMERHAQNALTIAEYLEEQPKIERVYYPGLASFPQHDLARKQMKNGGGILSFELKGGLQSGIRLMDHVQLMTLAVSLGTVDTLIQHPASMTHSGIPREQREEGHISDGLVRLSVGLEAVEDLIADLEQALSFV